MISKALLSTSILLSAAALNGAELELPNATWQWDSNGFICTNTEQTTRPDNFNEFDVNFTGLITNNARNAAKLDATFVQDGNVCNYEALVIADELGFAELTQSVAYSLEDASIDCQLGKADLDEVAAKFRFAEWGRYHVAALLDDSEVNPVCTTGLYAIDFVLTGRI